MPTIRSHARLRMAPYLCPMSCTLSPGLTHVGVGLAVGCIRGVGSGSERPLKILPGENGPLWEQPHLLSFPIYDQVCLNVHLFCMNVTQQHMLDFSRRLLLSRHECVQGTAGTQLKLSTSEIQQRIQLQLMPRFPFQKEKCWHDAGDHS